MTIQSQLDTVLALAEKATPDWRARAHGVVVGGEFNEYTNGKAQSQVASFNVMSNRDNAIGEQVANTELAVAAVNFLREHGPAIRAAVGGEAVAWRMMRANGKPYTGWKDLPVPEWASINVDDGMRIEYAYASPPATVDVVAFDRLREKWISTTNNTFILRSDRDYIEGYDEALKTCAKELAALIGEKA